MTVEMSATVGSSISVISAVSSDRKSRYSKRPEAAASVLLRTMMSSRWLSSAAISLTRASHSPSMMSTRA